MSHTGVPSRKPRLRLLTSNSDHSGGTVLGRHFSPRSLKPHIARHHDDGEQTNEQNHFFNRHAALLAQIRMFKKSRLRDPNADRSRIHAPGK
jgi:hypothetical protein